MLLSYNYNEDVFKNLFTLETHFSAHLCVGFSLYYNSITLQGNKIIK